MKNILFVACIFGEVAAAAITCSSAGAADVWQTVYAKGSAGSGENTEFTIPDGTATAGSAMIELNLGERHQAMWGYGGALTDSCVDVLGKMSPAGAQKLLERAFSRKGGAGFSYIRVPLGANDFSNGDYTMDDVPSGQTDPTLKHFDFSREANTIERIHQIMAIRPDLKILVSPWSAPAWMKDTGRVQGGLLLPQYEEVYARYLVRSLEEFARRGVVVDTLTIINEPLIFEAVPKRTWGYAQMYVSTEQQERLVTRYLEPLLENDRRKGVLRTRVLLHDHNWDVTDSPTQILLDQPALNSSVAGVAFHCYRGKPEDVKTLTDLFPSLPIFHTECSAVLQSSSPEGDWGDFKWWLSNYSMDVTQLGFVGAMAWNLCLDPTGGPKNDDGCATCRGMFTVSPDDQLKMGPEFSALEQMSRYLLPGAVRIGSAVSGASGLPSVAFQNPDGSIVEVLRNESDAPLTVQVNISSKLGTTVVAPARSALSLRWKAPETKR